MILCRSVLRATDYDCMGSCRLSAGLYDVNRGIAWINDVIKAVDNGVSSVGDVFYCCLCRAALFTTDLCARGTAVYTARRLISRTSSQADERTCSSVAGPTRRIANSSGPIAAARLSFCRSFNTGSNNCMSEILAI